MMNNWSNIYQSIQQAQQMQNMAINQMNLMPQMNPMIMQMNQNQKRNPMDQIQFMSNLFQNQNQFSNIGGNPNFNNFGNQNFNRSKTNNDDLKINVIFCTLKGARINMRFNEDETVNSALTKFLKRVNLENLINNTKGKLNFVLAAETLTFNDYRKIKDISYGVANGITIIVHDTKNLIGAN